MRISEVSECSRSELLPCGDNTEHREDLSSITISNSPLEAPSVNASPELNGNDFEISTVAATTSSTNVSTILSIRSEHETRRHHGNFRRKLHSLKRLSYLIVTVCVIVIFKSVRRGNLPQRFAKSNIESHQPLESSSLSQDSQRFSSEQNKSSNKTIQQSRHNFHFFSKLRSSVSNRIRALGETVLSPTESASKSGRSYKLVVAGKLSIFDSDCNIAQFNLLTSTWNTSECVQLNLYNSFSGGNVYSLLANHSGVGSVYVANDESKSPFPNVFNSPSVPDTDYGGGELIVVGAFDTTYRNSQVTYCSVGKWNGEQLSKVGEGLCNSALSKGMKITTAALAGNQDVFVAGSFVTQVWNGEMHEFVKIFNIAHFNARAQVWLPLNIGQISCSWCTVTVLALAWDSKREQLHVAGKFNAIDGHNIPAGLAIYNRESGHLVAHPGGGLAMLNLTEDGVATALQLDEESGVLYVMGAFQRLTATGEQCDGIAAYEIVENRWTCLADHKHSVLPSVGGNMLLTPYGLMVSGMTAFNTTWQYPERPYTIALLSSRVKTASSTTVKGDDTDKFSEIAEKTREFNWTWLPGFPGHHLPLHTLSNGFNEFSGTVFIGGDNFIAKWSYKKASKDDSKSTTSESNLIPTTEDLTKGVAAGKVMAMSQLIPNLKKKPSTPRQPLISYSVIIYFMALGSVVGVFLALMCNKSLNSALLMFLNGESRNAGKGLPLDTLTYSAIENTNVQEAYYRAMQTRFVQHPLLLTLIDPHEIFLHRIIGEGTFGRVWSAKWRSSSVAVKEFVFAQAAVAGRSSMQKEIIDEIIGEAGMMAILRHPHVLQLFGCSLTAQAIWIVSELCSLGSLRQLLDNKERDLPITIRLQMALHVAEGMTYLHTQNPPIIHRDLKSHNIFVHETFTGVKVDNEKWKDIGNIAHNQESENGHKNYGSVSMLSESTVVAKIGDWGSARAALSGSRTMTHGVGTACWLAPEVIKHARSSKYSDVYSFGIVLWELATREEVYQGLETTQIIARVAGDNLRPEVPENCLWKDIMVKCWDEIPQNRLNFETIVVELNKILQECKKESGIDLGSHQQNACEPDLEKHQKPK